MFQIECSRQCNSWDPSNFVDCSEEEWGFWTTRCYCQVRLRGFAVFLRLSPLSDIQRVGFMHHLLLLRITIYDTFEVSLTSWKLLINLVRPATVQLLCVVSQYRSNIRCALCAIRHSLLFIHWKVRNVLRAVPQLGPLRPPDARHLRAAEAQEEDSGPVGDHARVAQGGVLRIRPNFPHFKRQVIKGEGKVIRTGRTAWAAIMWGHATWPQLNLGLYW